MFARELLDNIQADHRFPDMNIGDFHYAAANYIDPVFKGAHVKNFGKDRFEEVKAQLELLSDEISDRNIQEVEVAQAEEEVVAPLSPTSKLMSSQASNVTLEQDMFDSNLVREMERFENLVFAKNKKQGRNDL